MSWLQTDSAIQVLKTIGLVIFVAIFTGVVIWLAFRKRTEIKHWSQLPLDE